MAIPLNILGTVYNYPQQGEQAPWGDAAFGWAQAVTNAIANNSSPTDIPNTLALVPNNQSLSVNVTSLSFDITKVRSAVVTYSLYRSVINTGTYLAEYSETGSLYLTYKTGSASWELGQTRIGNSGPSQQGVTFSITPSGQVQLMSDNITSLGTYVGTLRFSAKTFST